MKGPFAPGATCPVTITYATTPTLAGYKVVSSADGSTAVAHSTSLTSLPGLTYTAEFTLPTEDGFYIVAADDNGGTPEYDSEEIWVTSDVALLPTIEGPGAVTPYTTANPFRMKRGDTKPDFGPVQLLNSDGSHYQIAVSSTVEITVQKAGAGFATPSDFTSGTVVYHHAVTSWTTDGAVTHSFAAGEVTWIGECWIEIEVNTLAGQVVSFPGAGESPAYIPARFVPDEDPGVNP